jgi:hypothetical protein
MEQVMKILRILSFSLPAALALLTSCGDRSSVPVSASSGKDANSTGDVAKFVKDLRQALVANPGITSATEVAGLDSTLTVLLSSGKSLSIQRHSKINEPLGVSVFDGYKLSDVEPTTGKDATCLKQFLAEAEAAGYEPAYAGILFSETTLLIGYLSGEKAFSASFDLGSSTCYASWKH